MTNLYETDFFEWTQVQAKALDEHNIEALDWNHLKEEIEDLGNEKLNAVNSFLKRLIEHRLKLDYSQEIYPRNHWLKEVDNCQDEIEYRITKAILNKLDLPKQYERARRIVLREYKLDIPKKCPYTFDELMTRYPLDNN
ncbi:MAG: DUF29 domain-containing protein [Crocosphaera sp.]|nr:DUF29 domain-containing protein [Crocosphaera sp.]